MKKLDKLILGSFLGPFLLTFIVVDFILLTVNMLKYFDEIFGKGLAFSVYMELIGYFVISISPMALPLAVLLSSLMTFGNLGEHFELTAIKSSGISLLRALRPIGIFVFFLAIGAYLSNNYLVPKVNLKTFGLLYDIRMKSPALDIKEGVFYNGIPNYSIKVNRKLDEVRLQDVIIYDHSEGQGNIGIILADSGRMEPFFNDSYMSLTLYHGYNYKESRGQRGIMEKPVDFSRTKFSENQIIFNLESFQLNRTPEDLWSTNRSIKNIAGLRMGLDSLASEINQITYLNYLNTESSYPYFARERKLTPPKDISERKRTDDSIRALKTLEQERRDRELTRRKDSITVNGSGALDSLAFSVMSETQDQALASLDSDLSQRSDGGFDPNALIEKRKKLMDDVQDPAASDSGNDSSLAKPTFPVQVQKEIPQRVFSPEKKAWMDSMIVAGNYKTRAATVALNNARTLKNNFNNKLSQIDNLEREYRRYQIAWYQKYTSAFACIVMFMIGAPLGAIIKKGGLGMPVLISIIFFIVYYMLTITGEKWVKEGLTDPFFGTAFSNLMLLPFGLFFLRQARKDARLFEPETYTEGVKKLINWFKSKFS
ncbi:LptF/LptG family permease [Rhodonellum sp.]|uniref:LptF/LptG family permease n=1 Tax=Rhodonellum sp. TaxID=2231180 RepID=UPI00271E94E1|nr:LptF/LptG family permease [Rhodonellum sp.]MDO9553881.1 LptF/LptG family permease [Rhodonellum sp.]